MSATDTPAGPDAATDVALDHQVELDVTGMTCASCANRIERKLNKLDGVAASVNYATERAAVRHAETVTVDDLLATVSQAGYAATRREPEAAPSADPAADEDDRRADPELDSLRQRLLVSALLTAPVVLLAMVPPLQFTNWQWASLTLAAPVAVWGAWPFHRAAAVNLRHGATTMDTLVSLGVWAAFGWSLFALFFGSAGEPGMTHGFELGARRTDGASAIYLEVAAAVTTFLLAGRWFERRAKRRSGDALRALMRLGARDVGVLRPGPDGAEREERVPTGDLVVGMRFVVRPGERLATDGEVESGSSAVDASLVTGESAPVEVGPGDAVVGGTVNEGGRLVVGATRVGADTQLAQMARLVEEAQSGKAEVQRLADRVSAVFVPIVIALSVATLAGWLLAGQGATAAFTASVAVLIVACPCALGLATPTALLVGTGRGAQLGVLVRGPEVLESTRRVDTIVLDKTGTLTTGRMELVEVVPAPGEDAREVRRVAAAAESGSEHPVGRAIADAAEGERPPVQDFRGLAGLGVRATVGRSAVVAGRRALLEDEGLAVSAAMDDALAAAQDAGRTAVLVGWDGHARGMVAVADAVRPSSAEAVARFRDLGLRPVLLTGDHERVARAVAAEVGIEEVVAGVLPQDKVVRVRALQDEGCVVAMVGDGVNDAAALAQADLGLAMGAGSDVAVEASDLTLVRDDLLSAVDAVRLSRRTLATIRGNLFWAFGYNVAALPLAAAGLLNPMIAGGAMALSSVFVVSNSLRLRRFR